MSESVRLAELLRIHKEPCVCFNDWQIHGLLTQNPVEYLDAIFAGLQAVASGVAVVDMPPKMLFADPGVRSDFRVMPCVVRYADRVRKTVKIIGTNWPRQIVPGEISVGKAFALHETENFIEAEFAGCILSSARTGACVATALRLLRPDAVSLAIVGAGRVGFYAALYVAASAGITQIKFCDINTSRAEIAAVELAKVYPKIDVCTCSLDVAHQAEVVVLATDSESSVFGSALGKPSLVISVGADTGWQRELNASVLDYYAVYVDTYDSCVVGDMRAFQELGLLEKKTYVDLMMLLKGGVQPRVPAIFISTGSALFDNLTIDYLLRRQQ